MPKLKQNHNRNKNPFVGMTLRVFMMIAIMLVLFYIAYKGYNAAQSDGRSNEVADSSLFAGYERNHLIPEVKNVEVIHHNYYSLGYSERHEQAAWVCYVLNKDELRIPNVKRHDRFIEDTSVSTKSANYYDYRGSGYSRGHMAPAGDMAFNEKAMKESFYMSNMSPQVIPFNGGVWRELEESVRDWAYKNDHLYVVTGPMLHEVIEYIGQKTKVAVPKYFYKAVMDIDGSDKKGIAFIMPNEKSAKPIMDYAVTIDELEQQLGFDLFPNLLEDDDIEEKLESQTDTSLWPTSKKRYNLRVNSWNNN